MRQVLDDYALGDDAREQTHKWYETVPFTVALAQWGIMVINIACARREINKNLFVVFGKNILFKKSIMIQFIQEKLDE